MNPNDQAQDAMELEIEKRRTTVDEEVQKTLAAIGRKPLANLTLDDKGFIQARRSYLSRAQNEEYKDVLNEDLNKNSANTEPTRAELNTLAEEAGVDHPEKLPSKQAVLDAIAATKEE